MWLHRERFEDVAGLGPCTAVWVLDVRFERAQQEGQGVTVEQARLEHRVTLLPPDPSERTVEDNLRKRAGARGAGYGGQLLQQRFDVEPANTCGFQECERGARIAVVERLDEARLSELLNCAQLSWNRARRSRRLASAKDCSQPTGDRLWTWSLGRAARSWAAWATESSGARFAATGRARHTTTSFFRPMLRRASVPRSSAGWQRTSKRWEPVSFSSQQVAWRHGCTSLQGLMDRQGFRASSESVQHAVYDPRVDGPRAVVLNDGEYAEEDVEDFDFTVENLMSIGYDRESAEHQVAVNNGPNHTCDRAVDEE